MQKTSQRRHFFSPALFHLPLTAFYRNALQAFSHSHRPHLRRTSRPDHPRICASSSHSSSIGQMRCFALRRPHLVRLEGCDRNRLAAFLSLIQLCPRHYLQAQRTLRERHNIYPASLGQRQRYVAHQRLTLIAQCPLITSSLLARRCLGFVVTGGQDCIINVFASGSRREEPEYTLLGHSENICALHATANGTIISGSWDKSALLTQSHIVPLT